ncbi:Predicted nucleotide-binding protein, sugar kinase/HSP70/actin superfamily [Thermosyntropha lipolytica DSM 11003]|uniref:Predicted nucleotide-binding protein, sugar kinase/HSP70/actin superfamily n=1 Tax=Thermosyntropha lipolytica DSM 11003 TaxID=1123382 RepID=A0A1M5M308_9FIRM|nr:acyl-CoA dehydratase activase-related protein [Thermosyntropha lipolytica]SHG71628.1 Predicted nucleotide-binding protein, sugar kinase/HSP70/actin superfamily [Thermosyntropha lipolytica DSM 11003]
MKKVGIPQGLFYYYYYPLWEAFFRFLGLVVVRSSPTNKKIVDDGVTLAVDEACFPIKVYYGHVNELKGKGVDYIFLPRLVSIEPKSYICPKFMGLPDMIRAGIKDLPEVIDITVDLSRGDKGWQKELARLGKILNVNYRQIKKAYNYALEEYFSYRMIARQGYTRDEAIKVWQGEEISLPLDTPLHIGVLGHGYSLYDDFISMSVIKKLRGMGVKVYLSEHLPTEGIEKEASTLPKRVFWTLGRKMVGSALYMDKSPDIDGIIYVACFGCGPDSLIGEVIERKVKKPFMLLTLDEHTGEGGIITRLEAFCDMLARRKKRDEGYLPCYG